MMSCPAAEMVDGSQVLYLEQAFWRTPQKPFRQVSNHSLANSVSCLIPKLIHCLWFQRLYMVKPCPKELKCDVEVRIMSSSYVFPIRVLSSVFVLRDDRSVHMRSETLMSTGISVTALWTNAHFLKKSSV